MSKKCALEGKQTLSKGEKGNEIGLCGFRALLDKEMATHSSILAWEIPWAEEPGGLQSMGLQESDMTQ